MSSSSSSNPKPKPTFRPARFSGRVKKTCLPLCISAALLSACKTERVTTSDGWPLPPAPNQAPQAPQDTRADRMVFSVGSKPDDTNNNGYPDTIRASVALFSSQHPTALRNDGAFVFTLCPQGTIGEADIKPIASWRIEKDSPHRALTRTLAGPAYLFNLSLLDAGGDRLPLDRADIICRFEPTDGSAPVNCDGVRTIQIGRRMAAK
jgi:hypothetical protein